MVIEVIQGPLIVLAYGRDRKINFYKAVSSLSARFHKRRLTEWSVIENTVILHITRRNSW